MGHAAVGQVEIVGLRGIFGRECVYLLHHGDDAGLFAAGSDSHAGFLYIHVLLHAYGAGYLEIGESLNLGFAQKGVVEHIDAGACVELAVGGVNVMEFLEEPAVYLRELVYLIDSVSGCKGFGDDEYALVGGFLQGFVHIVYLEFFVVYEAVHTLADHAEAFLDGFLEGAAYGHHLAHTLHGRADLAAHAVELAEVPAGYLADDVVESRLEEGRGRFGHGVLEVKESVAQAELGGHEGQGIAGGL